MSTAKPAVVLLSGGLDSATVLAIAKQQGFDPVTLTFRYGQRHAAEIDVAARLAEKNDVKRHVVADIDLRAFGGSALTADIDVPKHRSDAEIGEGIPVTYVPARNTVFLSYALALAETTQAFDVFIGVNALDYSGYPDCRPAFVKAFEDVMNLATKAGVEGERPFTLHTPLIDMTKADIVKKGTELGVDYAETLSCYDPTEDGRHCGECDACHLRKKGFREAGLDDPTTYAA
ncbi:MAG: 7-cyano-7-deazaguanine synthase QueC [Rhodospirillales bacterium]|nr:7-cyano-7-deazaguanine synthase QueC [Rhodospirillales bacterium]